MPPGLEVLATLPWPAGVHIGLLLPDEDSTEPDAICLAVEDVNTTSHNALVMAVVDCCLALPLHTISEELMAVHGATPPSVLSVRCGPPATGKFSFAIASTGLTLCVVSSSAFPGRAATVQRQAAETGRSVTLLQDIRDVRKCNLGTLSPNSIVVVASSVLVHPRYMDTLLTVLGWPPHRNPTRLQFLPRAIAASSVPSSQTLLEHVPFAHVVLDSGLPELLTLPRFEWRVGVHVTVLTTDLDATLPFLLRHRKLQDILRGVTCHTNADGTPAPRPNIEQLSSGPLDDLMGDLRFDTVDLESLWFASLAQTLPSLMGVYVTHSKHQLTKTMRTEALKHGAILLEKAQAIDASPNAIITIEECQGMDSVLHTIELPEDVVITSEDEEPSHCIHFSKAAIEADIDDLPMNASCSQARVTAAVDAVWNKSSSCALCESGPCDALMRCGHGACIACLLKWFATHGQRACPTCKRFSPRIVWLAPATSKPATKKKSLWQVVRTAHARARVIVIVDSMVGVKDVVACLKPRLHVQGFVGSARARSAAVRHALERHLGPLVVTMQDVARGGLGVGVGVDVDEHVPIHVVDATPRGLSTHDLDLASRRLHTRHFTRVEFTRKQHGPHVP